jgi:hypothetical protein
VSPAGEREGRRQSCRREHPSHPHRVDADRKGGQQTRTHLEKQAARVDESSPEQGLQPACRGVEVVGSVGPDREVERDVEEAL